MTNAERIKALRNCANVYYEYRAEGASCSKCQYKEASYCKRTMMNDAADALEAADKRIAELEADKKTLINVVKDKSDFHATKDAMRIAELEAQLLKGEIVPCDDCKYRALASIGICWNKKLACVAGKRKENR